MVSALTAEELEIFKGMEQVYVSEEKRLTERAPRCHFRPMKYETGEGESWWECSHCGHTKPA